MASTESQTAGLTPSQKAFFLENGYLIIPSALPPSTVSTLLSETHRLLSEFDLTTHPLTRFSTGGSSGSDHVGDDYFLSSGDKIRFFFEEDAFDSQGNLIKPKDKAINKIGHYLHGLNPAFASLLATSPEDSRGWIEEMKARPAAVAKDLGFKDPRCLQSMVICKQPEIGGAVPPHQDSTFLYTNPPSAVGFWYALEDATIENGCLSFLPGSHLWAPIEKRLVRKEGAKEGTEMVDNDGPRFPPGEQYGEDKKPDEIKEKERKGEDAYVAGEVKAGDLVLIHGNILHRSERNLSQKGRIIYTFHVIEGGEGREYDERNWLQPPEEGFTRLYA